MWAQKGSKRVPKGFGPENTPTLWPGAQRYVRAYDELMTERPIVAGMMGATFGPIPLSSIHDYAERRLGIDPRAFEMTRFISFMRRQEIVDTRIRQEQLKKKPQSAEEVARQAEEEEGYSVG